MKELRFEWDSNKAQSNVQKHGVSFQEAKTAFEDVNGILFDDPDHSESEERFILLGLSAETRLLIVCHCYRGLNEVIRIISARKATAAETHVYNTFNRRR